MQSISLVFCLVALMSFRVHSLPVFDAIEDESNQVDNNLQANGGMSVGLAREPWVKITLAPAKMVKRESGSTVELECEASGSPTPVITWLRDQIPIIEDDFENNNFISELSYTAMAVAGSKLIINNFQPAGKNVYTCFARSGPAVARTSTLVHTYHHKAHPILNQAEYGLLNQEVLQKQTKPTIVSYFRTVMEDMGNTIVVPCKVAGYPKADVSWFYNDAQPVEADGSRVKITGNGELVFHKLSWADMGQYTCVARNSLGTDVSNTFIYPLAVEK